MTVTNIDQIIANITEEVSARIIASQKNSASAGTIPGGAVPANISKNIEHCLLDPGARVDDVKRFCGEARDNGFSSICILPWYVSYAASLLKGSNIDICTIIGLPNGASSTPAKGAEAREAVRNGATVLDIAVNVSAIKSGDLQKARNDIEETVAMTHYAKPKFRLILEHAAYTKEEKARVCELAILTGANGIYLSNANGGGKASAEEVKLVRSLLGSSGLEIKVSGEIKDASHAKELVAAGADRIASSRSVDLVR